MASHKAAEPIPHPFRRAAVLAVLVGAVTAVALSDPAHAWVQQVLAKVADLSAEHRVAGMLLFLLLSAVSAMAAFFSSALIVPAGVQAWGPMTTAALLWGGWLLGGAAAYWLGRTLGRRVATWFVARSRLDYYAKRISAKAGFPTILLFQTALPSEIPGYVLGSLKYRFITYFAALAIVEVPFALGAVWLGDSFINRRYSLLLSVGIAGIVGSALALAWLRRRLA